MVGCLQCGNKTTNAKFCSLSCSSTYNNKRKIYPKPRVTNCLECEKKTTNAKFCSKSCSAKYNNKNRHDAFSKDKRTKIVNCVNCRKEIGVNIRSSPKRCLCIGCKEKRKTCKQCGENICIRPDICKKYKLFPSLVKYFGFDRTTLGNILLYEEFERIKNILHEEYHSNGLSINDLIIKFCKEEIPSNDTFYKIFKAIGLETRNVGEATTLALINGMGKEKRNTRYKSGWHTTWNGEEVFYRSSYELDYCNKLDEQKIEYMMECKRFWYWDSQQQKQRIAIPDFYIPKDNMIVEIKSNWTYDVQNMEDRIKVYKEHGYGFKLILDKKEVSL